MAMMAMAIKIQAFMWLNTDMLVQWILQSHIRSHQYASQFAEPNQKDPFILPTKVHQLEPPATSKHQQSCWKRSILGTPQKTLKP